MTEIVVKLTGTLNYPGIAFDMSSAGLTVHALPQVVSFDLGNVRFVEPSGAVMLHNLTRYLLLRGCNVFYRNYSVPNAALIFLDSAGFFEDVLRAKAFQWTRRKSTTLSLKEISTIDAHGWVSAEFLPWLAHCSNRSESALGHFGVCISEIFNNIKDHSAHLVGSIFAQWYPNINTLKLAVGDFGCGIPATVATVEPGLAGASAIERAFAPKFTSQSTPKNRGMGLDFLRQNVCQILNGRMTVYSGGAAVLAQEGGQILHLNPIFGNSGYTGTLFEIVLPTHRLPEANPEEEEMIW